MARKVVAPDGSTWKVGRRWRPERFRVWRPGRRNVLEYGGLELMGGVVLGVVVVVFFFVVIPVVSVALEIVVFLVLLVAGIATRVLRRRPWTVQAVCDPWERHTWLVVGWRASRAKIDAAADAIERTGSPYGLRR